MTVKKINNKWYILGKLKKDDGTYYNYKQVAKGCKLKKEAEAYEVDFKRQWQDIQISKGQMMFKDLCGLMLASDKAVKAVTARTDQDALKKVCETMGKKKINLITREYLQKYINSLEEQYSKSYVSKIYYTIRKVFNYAVDTDLLAVNPMLKVKRSARKDEIKQEMSYWEPDQFKTFIKSVDDLDLRAFFVFQYYMGSRKSETLALQWKDIDFDARVVMIYKTVTNKIRGQAWAITSPKTKNSIRNISMPNAVYNELLQLKERQESMYGFNEERYLFGYHRPMPAETIRRKLDRYIALANKGLPEAEQIPRIRMHDFRHSHASYLINNMSNNFTDFDIAKRLGDTVQTLHETYAHWFKQADKSIIDFIDQDNA